MSAQLWSENLRKAAATNSWRFCQPSELQALMGPTEGVPEALVAARAQKAALLWVRQNLAATLAFNRQFKDKTGIGWLDKLLTAARLKELSKVKITKAGKSSGLRYDAAGLRATFYGAKLLDGAGFQRRTSLTKEEFSKVVAACARIKLKLPEIVEPTTTEKFFGTEMESA